MIYEFARSTGSRMEEKELATHLVQIADQYGLRVYSRIQDHLYATSLRDIVIIFCLILFT